MKVARSNYLIEIRPLLEELLKKLSENYPYVSILAEDCYGKNLQVSAAGESIIDSERATSRGMVIRIHDGHGFGEYACNDIRPETMEKIVKEIREMEPFQGSVSVPEETEMSLMTRSDVVIDPASRGNSAVLSLLREARQTGMDLEDCITDCPITCGYKYTHQIFLSNKRRLEQNFLWLNYYIGAYVERDGERKHLYRSNGGAGGLELLSDLNLETEKVARDAVGLLGSGPIQPGEYTCICSPDVTGLIAHESFGHGVEMDMFVKKRAMAENYMGKKIASVLVSLHDNGQYPSTGMYSFDDEGTLASDTKIIENGILINGISDALSAIRLGENPTGNGRRQNIERKAYARMTNTYIQPGKDKLEDMIAGTDHGFLLDYVSSGMEDPKNWGIQCIVEMAREIKDGRVTGRVFSPCVLTGYVPELLESIDMVSEEFSVSGGGGCGKGYKEFVCVSTGGPWIRAKIRLG